MKILYKLFCIIFLLILTFSAQIYSKEHISLYTYLNKPPFIVDKENESGLSYDLVRSLNQFSTNYTYQLVYIPKQRSINFLIDPGVLLWVNPLWVKDKEKIKYAWIEDLIKDKELYITNDPSLRYKNPTSLFGKTLVGVRGYTYINLENLVKKHKINRVDVTKELLVPQMLIKNRADIGVIGMQTYSYIQKEFPKITEKLFILENYEMEFTRSVLISKANIGIKDDINIWLASVQGKAQWLAMKQKWLHPW